MPELLTRKKLQGHLADGGAVLIAKLFAWWFGVPR
ncbi:hypothetical protein GGQ68_004070 [Sagittula marina]|uniref:Uncharacterized protein n=1 Tax=Sagittula marina TaxID=943940 RepID=A0A7W6DVH3_9RHOB|nr:hypothetical protein [Sagittula marina]